MPLFVSRRRVEPGWRYTLAQLTLSVLFGRRWHYISPWANAGAAACLIVAYGNKILLAQRRGNIEHAGRWSVIGGFLEILRQEFFPQAVAREFFEETGLDIDPEQFSPSPTLTYIVHGQEKIEQSGITAVVGYYLVRVEEDIIPFLKLEEETAAFAWFSEQQCEEMVEDATIPPDFKDLHQAVRETFRRLREGEEFPLLRYPRV